MIQLLGFLIIPLVGLIAIILNSVVKRRMKPDKIVFAVAIVMSFLFFIGLLEGFSGFSMSLVKQVDFSVTFQLNSLSLPFMLLAIVLPALGLLAAHKEIHEKEDLFYVFYLISYMSLIAVFMSTNLITFFVFWEAVLISFFFVIAYWGEKELRGHASMKFLVFTQLGSLLLLGAFILMFIYTGSFNLTTIRSMISSIPAGVSYIIFAFVLVAAMLKMPIFPLHSWLPDAHSGAPTAGSVLLAGILLKMGGYALLLFGITLLPGIASKIQTPMIWLGIITVIYIAFVASAQRDFKRMIAYSSVLYMGLAFMGAFSLTKAGIGGSVLLMVSHGFIVGMLFVLAGILKEKTGTRDLNKLGGLMGRMPAYAFFLVFAVIATLGVPGLSNFIGEFLVFIGSYSVYPLSLISLVSILIATNYYLMAVKKILFSSLAKSLTKVKDISYLESVQLSLFTVFIVVIGLMPGVILNAINITI